MNDSAKTCPECGAPEVRAAGNAETGITIWYCADNHVTRVVTTRWGKS